MAMKNVQKRQFAKKIKIYNFINKLWKNPLVCNKMLCFLICGYQYLRGAKI